MPKPQKLNLAGLVEPITLEAAEKESIHPVHFDFESCDILEIRYDFFEESLWPELSSRVHKIAPNAKQIGTIRLKKDGGTFPDARAVERPSLWEKIMEKPEVPDWIDLERDYLHDYGTLQQLVSQKQIKILISEHNFARIPSDLELKNFTLDVKRIKADGIKIAAMSNSAEDCDRLYKFAKKQASSFDLVAAFGMGSTGKISRLWSLKEGANLTYGSIGESAAPGQIDVGLMRKAIDSLPNMHSQLEISSFLNIF